MIKQLMAALTSVIFAAPSLPQELPPPYLLQSLLADCKSDRTIESVSCQTYIRGVFDLMLINSFVLKSIEASRTRLLLGEYAVCPTNAVTIGAMKQGLINWAEKASRGSYKTSTIWRVPCIVRDVVLRRQNALVACLRRSLNCAE